jgi:hypothetical protein
MANVLNWPANPLQADPPQVDPFDFTGRYNTQLSPQDEAKFLAWATDRMGDLYDYDLRGAWQANAQAAGNGHYPDTYKKPNHPTFSDQSQYHGVGGYTGGSWGGGNGQPFTFTPSTTNLQMMSPAALQRYFQKVEPGNRLILPSR